ncbi:hypothetical protein [Fulvivirga lutea]|uniref:Uncharacterized protein n=1 Tax=Fulvivirga lutea TaxID=2810512 RepID=A0A974WHD8_9BACT|nr:hypothetical protein [Fulvivirga lutea]QSE97267.1 hypothetical protein JR347_17010 [Fulvivirga lutea]
MKYIPMLLLVGLLAYCCKPTDNQKTANTISYWQPTSISKSETLPKEFNSYKLDFDKLKNHLTTTNKVITPTLGGEYQENHLEESGTMSPELAAKFPEIKSYKIIGNDDIVLGRIDINPSGFYLMITDKQTTYYINPVEKKSEYYIVYDKKYAVKNSDNPFIDKVIK